MASSFILTSAPLLLSQVPLASFVPDVSQPYADVKCPYTVSHSEYSVRPDNNFTGLVNTSSESLLQILVTNFADLMVRREQGGTFRVEAKRGNIYTLDSPDDLFTAILAGEEHGEQVKRRLEQWKRRRLAPRFVVGYRTFVNATLAREEHKSHGAGASMKLPIGAVVGDPSGMADIKLGAGHKTNRDAQGQAVLPGERIYAIGYRKIKITTHKGALAATLDLKTKWESFAGARGEGEDEDVYLQADISSANDDDDCEVFVIDPEPGENGEAVRIGVLSEDYSSEDEIADADADANT